MRLYLHVYGAGSGVISMGYTKGEEREGGVCVRACMGRGYECHRTWKTIKKDTMKGREWMSKKCYGTTQNCKTKKKKKGLDEIECENPFIRFVRALQESKAQLRCRARTYTYKEDRKRKSYQSRNMRRLQVRIRETGRHRPHDQEATVSIRLDATKGPSQGMDRASVVMPRQLPTSTFP